MEKKEREELIERLDIMDGFPEWKVPCHSCQKGGMIEDMNGNVYTCGECGGSEWIVNPELVKVFEQELDKAREEGIKEYIDLLQGIEHYEGLKMVRGLVGLDKHEKRDYYNLQRRFEELSKLKDNK